MNNKFIKSFITQKEKQLKLLKYEKENITEVVNVLVPLTLELMQQCYDHVNEFHHNQHGNKQYLKVKDKVQNQLRNMLLIKRELTKDYTNNLIKSKGDLFSYVYAYQINEHFYEQYIYQLLVESLKVEFSTDFWKENELERYVTGFLPANIFELFVGSKDIINTGRVDLQLYEGLDIIEIGINENSSLNKLDIIKNIGNLIHDYPDHEFLMLHTPYRSSINDLIDNIKVSLEYENKSKVKKRLFYRKR